MQLIQNIANMNINMMVATNGGNWGGNNMDTGFSDLMIVS